MKVIAIVLAGALLTGCYQSINQTDIKKAVTFCDGIENIEYIDSHANGIEVVYCLNGNEIFLSRVKM